MRLLLETSLPPRIRVCARLEISAGPGLQPVAGHVPPPSGLPRADLSRRRWVAVVMKFNDDDVVEILARINNVPDSLDRSELLKDILAAWDFYQGHKKNADRSTRTARRQYATKVVDRANELFHLLNEPEQEAEWVRRSIRRSLLANERDCGLSLATLAQELLLLASEASTTARKCTGNASDREILGMRASFWFIGHDLVWVYEKHFKKSAKRTRAPNGQPVGPFVKFATAVTARLGDPFTDETISKAISTVRKWNASPLNQ
jgi:hypothetical protein